MNFKAEFCIEGRLRKVESNQPFSYQPNDSLHNVLIHAVIIL